MAGHLQGAAVRDARDGEKAEGCGWDTDRSNEAEAAIAAADAGLLEIAPKVTGENGSEELVAQPNVSTGHHHRRRLRYSLR
jgi:hypothetical protein